MPNRGVAAAGTVVQAVGGEGRRRAGGHLVPKYLGLAMVNGRRRPAKVAGVGRGPASCRPPAGGRPEKKRLGGDFILPKALCLDMRLYVVDPPTFVSASRGP